MKIKDAVKRLGWRFSEAAKKDRIFSINQNDVDAINRIGKYVEEKEGQQFDNHELFAKLFIYLYMKILQNDNATVLDNNSRKKIYNLLDKDLNTIIQEFTDSLNESEQYELLESIQGDIKHPSSLSEENRKENVGKLQEAIQEPDSSAKLYGEVWEYDFVKNCLVSEVNQAIELFRKH